jgi:hypothetical protein
MKHRENNVDNQVRPEIAMETVKRESRPSRAQKQIDVRVNFFEKPCLKEDNP